MSAQAPSVAVIGSGIVGASTAYYLARRGARVTLFEKGRLAGEQSSRNWGAVRQQGRHPAELPLMMDCNRLWQGLEQELRADLGWYQQGQLRIAYDERTLAGWEAWLPVAREHGLDTRILGPGEVTALLPHYQARCVGGMFTPSDGCAEPEKVAPAFCAAAERHGAEIVTGCAVLGIDTGNGRVSGVETERGPLAADAVVCAAGAWATRVLQPLGLRLPTLRVRASAAHVAPMGLELRKLVVWGRAAYRQRRDGSLTIAPGSSGRHDLTLDSLRHGLKFLPLYLRNRSKLQLRVGADFFSPGGLGTLLQHRTLDPPPDLTAIRGALAGFREEYPGAGELRVLRTWAGYIDYTPDELPVIDAPGRPHGLVIATGLSGHGFGLGPVTGRSAAELALGERPSHDLSAFRLARFA